MNVTTKSNFGIQAQILQIPFAFQRVQNFSEKVANNVVFIIYTPRMELKATNFIHFVFVMLTDNSVQYQPALVLRFVRSEFLRRAVLLKLPDQFEQILRNYDTTVCVCYVYMSAVTRSSVTFLQWHFNHSRDMFWLSCVKVAFASGICSKKFIVFF